MAIVTARAPGVGADDAELAGEGLAGEGLTTGATGLGVATAAGVATEAATATAAALGCDGVRIGAFLCGWRGLGDATMTGAASIRGEGVWVELAGGVVRYDPFQSPIDWASAGVAKTAPHTAPPIRLAHVHAWRCRAGGLA